MNLGTHIHRRLLADDEPLPVLEAPVGPDRIEALVRAADPLLPPADVRRVVRTVSASVEGLGPVAPLFADPAVTDVLVNGPGPVWVERAGVLEPAGIALDRAQVDLLVERILGPLGRRVDPVSPVADARLADGSRVHVVVPPLAVDGPYVTVRRFRRRPIALADLAAAPVARLLREAVGSRANIVISGGTGSGKTTLLNALAGTISGPERIVTVEDAAELRLPSDHVVRLETRPGSVEGVAGVDVRELVRNALRMRPDRLVVGEVRGGEALDVVQAMNTGHDGSLTTVHANGCADALRRLETLVLLAGVGLPLAAVRDHLAAAVDLVAHLERGPDGSRRVVQVAEVVAPAGDPPGGPVPVRVVADEDRVVGAPTRPRRRLLASPGPGGPADPTGTERAAS